MGILTETLAGKGTVAILGHVNPDGDCIGSCLGMYNYLKENFDCREITVFLEQPSDKFGYLKGFGEIRTEYDPQRRFDLCLTLDASDVSRLGAFAPYLETAADSLCIDHHITNRGLARVNVIESEASSTCEVLFGLLEREKISHAVAECLYTGIIHDTGVFKYSNTSKRTMEIAGWLINQGLDFPTIIDKSFYERSYRQTRLLGQALVDSRLLMDGRLICSVLEHDSFVRYDNCPASATDGIIDQLRIVRGVEVAALLYATGKPSEYKMSLRTNSEVDVSRIAQSFGGGGHVKAAGCTVTGEPEEIIGRLCERIREQWDKIG